MGLLGYFQNYEKCFFRSSLSPLSVPSRSSFWRPLQAEELSEQYSEEDNTKLRAQFHSLTAPAFVPEEGTVDAFENLEATAVDELILVVFNYVEGNYVKGSRRGRCRVANVSPGRMELL
ncbi:hypothetical protein ANN_27142 [Periplaneta americana]|uniref:Per a allergen n=1 Tax=Periplaneta americana TaxID=6978 RepID=A0ABQ8RX71_PERAM|nr:hypothetical protein ANN_27142 [Periplaneta americana]